MATSVAFGFASRRFDQASGKWIASACIGVLFFLIQLGLVFVKSKEDMELAEFKRIQSAKNMNTATRIENRNKLANAAAERAMMEIDSGNLEQALKWSEFERSHHGE